MSLEQAALKNHVQRLVEALGSEHLAVADAWVKLGLSQLENGSAHDAEHCFRKALTVRLVSVDAGDETIAHIHYYLGRCSFEQGDYRAAEASYQECLDIYDRECHPEDAFLATVLDSFASLNHDRDRFEMAESLLKRSLFIRLCVLEPFDVDIAESLNHLGWLYSQRGDFGRAENLFLCALDIWITNFGMEHATIAMCLENYAFVLEKTGRRKEACRVLTRVDSIRSA